MQAVKEGLLLVTQRIFRQFTSEIAPRSESDEVLKYTTVQKAFFKAHWHYVVAKPTCNR
ncbi:hypothetical protein [Cupriavidus necator]|uniref:hypothetical protein n=1 Tax=Cupriavidus necator TaxID=106590 RepID=UPI003BEECB3A